MTKQERINFTTQWLEKQRLEAFSSDKQLLYLAQDGPLIKIGISVDPQQRCLALSHKVKSKVELRRTWKQPESEPSAGTEEHRSRLNPSKVTVKWRPAWALRTENMLLSKLSQWSVYGESYTPKRGKEWLQLPTEVMGWLEENEWNIFRIAENL